MASILTLATIDYLGWLSLGMSVLLAFAAYNVYADRCLYTKCSHGVWGAVGNQKLCSLCIKQKEEQDKYNELKKYYLKEIRFYFENKKKKRVDRSTFIKANSLQKSYANKIAKAAQEPIHDLYIDFVRQIDACYDNFFESKLRKKEEIKLQSAIKKKEKRKAYLDFRRDGEAQLYHYKTQSSLSKEEIGKRYERYIGYLYEKDGWDVDYQGIVKKKQDRGIDILAKKKNKILLIQCKMYGKDSNIRENTINQLYGTFVSYMRSNIKKDVIPVLVTHNDNLDDYARESLDKFPEIIHSHIPYTCNYPLVKCNISDEKIYHLPTDPMYDRIKITVSRGEFYCETIKEAEERGFRRVVIT